MRNPNLHRSTSHIHSYLYVVFQLQKISLSKEPTSKSPTLAPGKIHLRHAIPNTIRKKSPITQKPTSSLPPPTKKISNPNQPFIPSLLAPRIHPHHHHHNSSSPILLPKPPLPIPPRHLPRLNIRPPGLPKETHRQRHRAAAPHQSRRRRAAVALESDPLLRSRLGDAVGAFVPDGEAGDVFPAAEAASLDIGWHFGRGGGGVDGGGYATGLFCFFFFWRRCDG